MPYVYAQLSAYYDGSIIDFLILSGTPENLAKKQELWNYVKAKDKEVYKMLRYSMLGFSVQSSGEIRQMDFKDRLQSMNKWIGFN